MVAGGNRREQEMQSSRSIKSLGAAERKAEANKSTETYFGMRWTSGSDPSRVARRRTLTFDEVRCVGG
jgi:hypothetical protein